MSIRESFVEQFGEDVATKIEEASIGHINDDPVNHANDNWGSDPFRYHFMNCITHECLSRFAAHHGIEADLVDLMIWSRQNAGLLLFDGDQPDYIGLIAGAYHPWIDWEASGVEPPESWNGFEVRRQRLEMMTPEERAADMMRLANEAMRMLNDHGYFSEGPT